MTATGSKAAPLWSSITTAGWKSSTGPTRSRPDRVQPAPIRPARAGRGLMRILIVTDAWAPQVNGVVRTLQSVRPSSRRRATRSTSISPDLFRSMPCPTYPEIRLALGARRRGRPRGSTRSRPRRSISPPRGRSAWRRGAGACARGCRSPPPITPSFPTMSAKRTGCRPAWFWRYIRWFHRPAQRDAGLDADHGGASCAAQGIARPAAGAAASTSAASRPDVPPHPALADLPRPIQLYVGRVAVEKNIEAFLDCRHPGSKVVVGDGPALAELQAALSRRALPRRAARRGAGRAPMRRPTCSSSRAAPTRSGW